MIALMALVVLLSFVLSAAAGMGGSLLLVPAMAVAIGPKAGVAAAGLLLACNNVGKVFAYRKTIPMRASLELLLLTVLGAFLGAQLLSSVSETVVGVTIVVCALASFLFERTRSADPCPRLGASLGFAAGATSGFAGSSGPLKGLALRSIVSDRRELVGAASVVSLAGDLTKVAVYGQAGLLPRQWILWIVAVLPLMALGVFLGRELNERLGRRAYTWVFWTVMSGYSFRLLAAL